MATSKPIFSNSVQETNSNYHILLNIINVFQTDNGKEFQNNRISKWMDLHEITVQYCEKDDKKCLGVAERFNRTIKLMIEKYLTSKNNNRWIDYIEDFTQNYNSSYHSSIKRIPERLEIFDEVELIRANIAHNNKIDSSAIQKKDFVRLLNSRGAFEKEGQRFTCMILGRRSRIKFFPSAR